MVDSPSSNPGVPTPRGAEPTAPSRIVTPAQREAAIVRLSTAYARDILPVDEFERRVASVYRASTLAALTEITEDLPDDAPAVPAASEARPPAAQMSPRVVSIFSSVERSGHVVVPSRLEIRSVLGNVELDLREAEFGPGVTEIAVFNFFGSVEVGLPEDIGVENHGGAFLGSFAARATRGASRAGAQPASTVRITGRVILGNVEFDSRPRPAG